MNFVKSLNTFNRYLILLSVFFILITALAAFIYASVETAELWWYLISHHWNVDHIDFHFIEVIERFLTAIALLILGVGLYQLFIGKLDLPTPLEVGNFHQLKSNLGNVILLNMVVIFFGDLAEGEDPKNLVFKALAISIISAILIWFSQNSNHGSEVKASHNQQCD